MLTNCLRIERNDSMSLRKMGGSRYNSFFFSFFLFFLSKSERSITSKAFAKSTKRISVNVFRLMFDNRLSNQLYKGGYGMNVLSKTVFQEVLTRKIKLI